ncbi:MAG: hypothetical protein ACRD2O_12495, partial [Terriglobia bacterium]
PIHAGRHTVSDRLPDLTVLRYVPCMSRQLRQAAKGPHLSLRGSPLAPLSYGLPFWVRSAKVA